MSKLTALHINIIGIVVSIILSIALFFLLIKPKNDKTEEIVADTTATQGAGGTETAVKQKAKELDSTRLQARRTEAAWHVNDQLYMPKLNFDPKNETLDLYQQTAYVDSEGNKFGVRDMPVVWGRWLQDWYTTQRPGTTFVAANEGTAGDGKPYLAIPSFPVDPNQVSQLKSITFPEQGKTWRVYVWCTSFDNAMKHLEQFNPMRNHGMPVISNVAMAGHSPNLFMRYDMALYIIPPHDPPAQDPLINGAVSTDPNANPTGLSAPAGGFGGGPPRGGPPPGGPPGAGGR